MKQRDIGEWRIVLLCPMEPLLRTPNHRFFGMKQEALSIAAALTAAGYPSFVVSPTTKAEA